MKEQFHIFLTTLTFFTRIPVPGFKGFNEDYLNKCNRYFPVIGYLVGGLSFLAFWGASYLFPTSIAVIASLIVGVLITGAFHEDGFGDMFDGFGGGWTKLRILEIMKDSRLGTYGMTALIFLFLVKITALMALANYFEGDWWRLFIIFITYHALARTVGISLSFFLPYSREDATSKSKPVAKSYTWKEVFGALFFGLLPFGFLLSYSLQYWIILPVLAVLLWYARYYFDKWIDGFTGDCLGAVEQFAEIFILLTILALCNFM